MGILKRTIDAIDALRSRNVIQQESQGFLRVSALCSAYENVFPQVRALVDRMKMVQPYGIGRSGGRLNIKATPELAALNCPNEEMGWMEFADAMFVTWLTEKELNIHVWKNKRGRVEGYTILPPGSRVPNYFGDGRDSFQIWTRDGMQNLTSDEVMTLRFSRNPLKLDEGVSPASAIFTWSQVDDLMAQLQKARMENGAYPATITFIRARDRASFDKKRAALEAGLKGAKNANKTVYIFRQQLDDDTSADEMEVKTIDVPNSTLAIKDIMSIISDKVNKAYGTSNFTLGDDRSATYANAELSNLQFVEHRVAPALASFWNQFQHELDRVTGGLGYGITYDLRIPELTERHKAKAETNKIVAETLTNMLSAGASPTAAIKALGLDDSWLQVALGIQNKALASAAANSLGGTENKNTSQAAPLPSQDGAAKTPNHTNSVLEARATKDAESPAYIPSFTEEESSEKRIYDQLMKIAQAIADDLDYSVDEVAADILLILTQDATEGGETGAKKVAGLLGNEEQAEEIEKMLGNGDIKPSLELTAALQGRVDTLVAKFAEDVRETIAETLSATRGQALSASQIKTALSKVMPRYRAEMIARNEVGHAFEAGRLERDEQLAAQFGVTIAKVWRCHHDGATCPICEAMDGEQVELRQAFPDHVEREVDGEIRTFAFEHNMWNDDGDVPHAHVNCRCYFDEVIL